MRILIIILLFVSTASWGQNTIQFGASRIQDTSKTFGALKAAGKVILPFYATMSTSNFLAVNAQGYLYLTSGGGTAIIDTNFIASMIRDTFKNRVINDFNSADSFHVPSTLAVSQVFALLTNIVNAKQDTSQKVTTLSGATNNKYPSALAVFNGLSDTAQSLRAAIASGGTIDSSTFATQFRLDTVAESRLPTYGGTVYGATLFYDVTVVDKESNHFFKIDTTGNCYIGDVDNKLGHASIYLTNSISCISNHFYINGFDAITTNDLDQDLTSPMVDRPTSSVCVYNALQDYLPLIGGTLTGSLDATGLSVNGVPVPTQSDIDTKVSKSGDVMTGALQVGVSGNAQPVGIWDETNGAYMYQQPDGNTMFYSEGSNSLALDFSLGSIHANFRPGSGTEDVAYLSDIGMYVTSVDVAPLHGVSADNIGTATAPIFNFTLGAITPTTVVASSTISASNFSGSSSGTNTGDQTSVTGNAGTATALQTARNINGVAFNGTANITVPAAAGTLTGGTLASGVTASSLTSVGTIGTLNATTAAIGTLSLTGTGGANQVVKQPVSGGPLTVGALVNADLPTSGASAGTYGSSTVNLIATVNTQGIITSISTVNAASAVGATTYTPTVVGFSGTPTVSARYVQSGVILEVWISINGTSNTTNLTFTLPNGKLSAYSYPQYGCKVLNNSAPGNAVLTPASGSNIITVNATTSSATSNGFTNSGGKAVEGYFKFETI